MKSECYTPIQYDSGEVLAHVTGSFFEEGHKFFIIDYDFEEIASNFEEILDLTRGKHYYRPRFTKNWKP